MFVAAGIALLPMFNDQFLQRYSVVGVYGFAGVLLAAGALFMPWDKLKAPPRPIPTVPMEVAPVGLASPEGNREIGKLKVAMESSIEGVLSNQEDLKTAVIEIASTKRLMEDELIHKNQDIARLNGSIDKWEQGGIAYLDIFERVMSIPEVSDAEKASASRAIDEFLFSVQATGLEAIRPAIGERFSSSFHQGIGYEPGEGEEGSVARLARWGYRIGDRCIRRAEVALIKNS